MQYRFLLLNMLTISALAHNDIKIPNLLIVDVVNETNLPIKFYHLNNEIAAQQALEIAEQEANGIFTPLDQQMPGIQSATPGPNSPLIIPDAFDDNTQRLVLETPTGSRKFSLFRKGNSVILASDSGFSERELLLTSPEDIKSDRVVRGRLILRQHFLDTRINPTERAKFYPLCAEDMLGNESN